MQNTVDVSATFCFERCGRGPTVSIGNTVIEKCTLEKACNALVKEIEKMSIGAK